MHTWLATGLMGRVIRSRRTLALVAVLAVLAFALPVAFAQQGQAAPPASQVAAAVNPQTAQLSRRPPCQHPCRKPLARPISSCPT